MDLDLSEEQAGLQAAIRQLLARHSKPIESRGAYFERSPALEADLRASGFLDIAREEGMGPLEASLLVEEVAKLPYATEIGATALVAPMLTSQRLAGPVALVDANRPGPVRFLDGTGTALVDGGDEVRVLPFGPADIDPVRSPFAFPYGRFKASPLHRGDALGNVTVEQLRQWWRVALCFEAIGAMQASLDLTVGYVKDRKQFGHALGVFQTIQHRLSECAVLVQGARLLARKAAWSRDPDDAALAAGYVQDAATRLAYETHQFHGAIGLTLEYPLHFWTYRLRVLIGELGGPHAQFRDAVAASWPKSSEAA